MAYEVQLVNGVTKFDTGLGYTKYQFPLAIIDVYISDNYYKHFLPNGIEILKVDYDQITDTLGAANIEEYVDALANAGYFFEIGQGGGSTPVTELDNRVIVKQVSDFGVIESEKEYFLDGFITVTGNGVAIPDGVKLNLKSYNFNLGGIVNIDVNGRCVTGASVGDILATDCSFSATNGVAFEVTADTGNEAIEFNRVNFNGCADASMILTDFRQLLVDGCGFFGGQPNIELRGAMNGARITTTIVRGISNTTTFFKAGAGFEMFGSFLTDLNIDLGTSAVLSDFSEANFTDVDIVPNVLQFKEARVFRNSPVVNSDYASALPNINENSLACEFKENRGLGTTRKGGRIDVTTEALTTITTVDTYTDIAGTTTASKLSHTDSNLSFAIRNLDAEPNDFEVSGYFVVEGGSGDSLSIGIFSYDDGGLNETLIDEFQSTVDNSLFVSDTAKIYIDTSVTLLSQGYVRARIKNQSDTTNVTVTENSFFRLKP